MRPHRRTLLKAAGALGITSITGLGSARLSSQEGQDRGTGQAQERENMRLLDQNTLNGNGNVGEGYAMKETDAGRPYPLCGALGLWWANRVKCR